MLTTEVTKGNGNTTKRTPDVFAAMRDEMDRVFERFEHGWPRWPSFLRGVNERDEMVPDLDVRENATQVVIEADLPITHIRGVESVPLGDRTSRSVRKTHYTRSDRGSHR
jgi:hypothetical protein